ncbi:MAG: hypothetical protein ACREF4_09000 [Gammaproteobacteria bacterium]
MNRIRVGLAIAAILLAVSNATAQDNGKGKGPPAKVRVTTNDAVVVTREILVKNGYEIVRVEPAGATQVIWYRLGNRGKGKGLGPPAKIIVRPHGDVVVFEGGPSRVIVDVRIRLKL